MIRHFTVIIFVLTLANISVAQNSRDVGDNISVSRTIKLTPAQTESVLKAFSKHPYTRYYDRLIDEYEKRMKANVHKYKVMARKMQKPQYSDPSYFGHKRKPKKRPPGKRKYCNECGIVH